MTIVGFKVAGIKILVPWTNLQWLFTQGYEYEAAETELEKLEEQIETGL